MGPTVEFGALAMGSTVGSGPWLFWVVVWSLGVGLFVTGLGSALLLLEAPLPEKFPLFPPLLFLYLPLPRIGLGGLTLGVLLRWVGKGVVVVSS